MGMKRCIVPSILLMLALQAALLVAGDVGDILLPSQGQDEAAMAAKAAGPRPWECCDSPTCTKSNPPTCRCGDEVDECAPTCKTCLPARSHPSRRVCIDSYFGAFPPACTPSEAVAAGGN
ncbi:Bowman-Birk type trypsin inhibitor [Triticum urartu]|uniref:Bowman-Birk type trypsin inhibitor n=1 Tax=Triticum urartu TaxID=4572 RepID=M8AJL8_TRIUA|nr:Bowman-Birk type trypsin inhibitor [Triticum urartu]